MLVRAATSACLALALGCNADGGAKTAPEAPASAPVPEAPPSAAAAERRPPSQRIRGRWMMNLNDVPKEALAQELKRFKSSEELADMVRVEYTITETEWILHKFGAGGVYDQKWYYQILKEVDDALVIERIGDDGKPQQIQALVGEDKMVIGTGTAQVPLTRIR